MYITAFSDTMSVNGEISAVANHDINSNQPVKSHVSQVTSHPLVTLRQEARDNGEELTSRTFVELLDEKYPSLRHRFHIPKKGSLDKGTYVCCSSVR